MGRNDLVDFWKGLVVSHSERVEELFEGGYNDICILSLSLGATRTFEARHGDIEKNTTFA